MRILIVEDEPRTASSLHQGLQDAGYQPEMVQRGDDAVEIISTQSWDAVIMDIMLPGCDGLTAVRRLRERSNSTPILLLSALGEVDQRIEGLNAGADDYLPKPFSLGEVLARLNALTRRGGDTKAILLRVADLALDVPHRTASRGGRLIELSSREFRLLEVLMRQAGNVCPRSLLLREVWDYNFDPGTNLVDVYIRKLREKIDNSDDCLPLLHTIRGVGYMMSEQPPA
ncbi:MAG: two component transcriptional regulator, winged helix family [Verrucomicrobiales bacterium]|nr:two component transcriptional regulator, winged helix family [Verrucomicrobiales bacterium]